jgi:hypothetical protein
MSAMINGELSQAAVNVIRHTLEKDLNSRGWLQDGFVFFVREISEPGIVLLIQNGGGAAADADDVFLARVEVEWEDINEHVVKNRLAFVVGPEKARMALADSTRPDRKPSRGLHRRYGWLFSKA